LILGTFLHQKPDGIKAKTSISQELAHKTIDDKAKVELPEVYAKYKMVFKKEASE